MADMYGAVRSNVFKVKNVDAFKDWFSKNCHFGEEIELWADEEGVSFGGYEMYPTAYPFRMRTEEDDYEIIEWEMESFADAVRQHLQPGQEFRVLAGGNEKLRYVSFSHLVITQDRADYTKFYEGN